MVVSILNHQSQAEFWNMGFKNVLAFKFGDEGELINLDLNNIDEEFKSINALIFYIYNNLDM